MAADGHNSIVRVEATKAAPKISSAAQLKEFFKACDLREKGRELDWEEHLNAMEQSRKSDAWVQ